MQEHQLGKLFIDPVELQTDRIKALEGGNLVFEVLADQSLYDLLTNHFKANQYMPAATETFRQRIKMAGLPVHGKKSKKCKLIQSNAIQYCSDPYALVEKLQLLVGSKMAGNTGLDAEISAILDELMRTGADPKSLQYS